ncbi:thiamine pyrophosphate-binding protein [Candidatus Neomarinimicrobiota bacterium]
MHGGTIVAEVLKNHGVKHIFTLCGGHVSPILTGANDAGIRVIDTRQEATAVFAADGSARLTGIPGVAVVTAGPGVTNTITAVKNAQLAQSPVILIGGATATALKGRGALQDIDQRALFRSHMKWQASAKSVRQIAPLLTKAFFKSRDGIPGPVFLELPVDLLYPEDTVRQWYLGATEKSSAKRSIRARLQQMYLNRHVHKLFRVPSSAIVPCIKDVKAMAPSPGQIKRAAALILDSERPVMIMGSPTMADPTQASNLASAVRQLGIPTFLAGMSRGLLGMEDPLLCRHQRRVALKEADLVVLAGMPCDFRLNYGRQISRKDRLIAIHRRRRDLRLNRRPTVGIHADPGLFIQKLADISKHDSEEWQPWLDKIRQLQDDREQEIRDLAQQSTDGINPLRLLGEMDRLLDDGNILVADGGDFVSTASYTVRPRQSPGWLDPGVFGTLGVGAGFALAAKLCFPDAEVWILYGDGSVGYSIVEMDTFVRHNIPVIAVVGNDAGWTQINREQVAILGDAIGTTLAKTKYHEVAQGFGGTGILLDDPSDIRGTLKAAKAAASDGSPVLVNAILGKTEFRKGSISI